MIIPMIKYAQMLLFMVLTGVMLASTQIEGVWFAVSFVVWLGYAVWVVGDA